MTSYRGLALAAAVAALAVFAGAPSSARAQEAPAPAPATTPTPAPAQSGPKNMIENQYDGNLHVNVTPYVWLPTVNGTLQYQVPVRPIPGGTAELANLNVQVGPNGYLSKLNFAFMGAFTIRKGDVDVFGDFITLNATNGSTFVSSVGRSGGRIQVPVTLDASGRLTSTIYELAAGYTLYHSPSFAAEAFGGFRDAQLRATADWNLNVGKNFPISRSGSAVRSDNIGDMIVGLRGQVALDKKWFFPYYADFGTGERNNTTWQAYGGVGYGSSGGRVLLLFRNLSYNLSAGNGLVQTLRLGGPLVGYTIDL